MKLGSLSADFLLDVGRVRAFDQLFPIETGRARSDFDCDLPFTEFFPFTQRRRSYRQSNSIVLNTEVSGRYGHAVGSKVLGEFRIGPVRVEHERRTHDRAA